MVALEPEHRRYSQYDEGERELSLRDIIRILVRRLWVIVLVVVAFTGVAVGFSLAQTPEYEASVKILVSPKPGEDAIVSLGSDVAGLQQLIKTLTQAADTRPMAEAVVRRLNLETTPDSLLENLEAQQIPETQFIQVSYVDTRPERARLIANTTGELLSEQISEGKLGTYAVTARVFEPAETPDSPVSPEVKLNIFLALVAGVAFGIALAFLLENLGVGIEPKKQEIEPNPALGPRPLKR